MAEITARGRVPLLAGGTILYFKALQDGPVRPARRQPRRARRAGSTGRGTRLAGAARRTGAHRPATAARLAPNDAQRIQRALEIHRLTGQPMSALIAERPRPAALAAAEIALLPSERSVLHQRIATRFTQMLDAGLLDEVRALRAAWPNSTSACPRCAASATARPGIIWTATSTASN